MRERCLNVIKRTKCIVIETQQDTTENIISSINPRKTKNERNDMCVPKYAFYYMYFDFYEGRIRRKRLLDEIETEYLQEISIAG